MIEGITPDQRFVSLAKYHNGEVFLRCTNICDPEESGKFIELKNDDAPVAEWSIRALCSPKSGAGVFLTMTQFDENVIAIVFSLFFLIAVTDPRG